MKVVSRICLILVAAAIVSVCHADVVSWNYDSSSTVGGDGAGSLPALTEQAGLELVGGWVNTWPDNQTTDLRDDSGVSTTIDIAWENPASYSIGGHPGQDADGSWNKEMINGYMNAGVAGWTDIAQSTVTLSQIPYLSYNIIVYFSCDVTGRTGTVSDGTTTYYFNTLGPASVASGNALFVQATATTDAGYAVVANYAVFTGLSGDSQTVTCDIPDWGGIAAVQIYSADPRAVQETDPYSGETDVAVDLSDRTIANNLSWVASSDPNIAEVKGYDIFLDPNEIKVSDRDSGCLIADSTAAGVTQYDPASDFDYLKKYYWAVDTRYTRDDDPNLGTPTETIYVANSLVWNFETVSAVPDIATYDDVVTTTVLLPAAVSAVVTDGDNDVSTAVFTLLTDDGEFPAGATASLQNEDYSDLYAPSCELATDTPGVYKIKLAVTDGAANSVEDLAAVVVYAGDDAGRCDAAEHAPSWAGWNPMDFNYDCFVNLEDLVEIAGQWLDDRSLKAQESYSYDPDYIQYGPVVNGIVDGNLEAGEGEFVGYYNQWWWWNEPVVLTGVDPIEGSWSAEWTTSTWESGVTTYQTVKASTSYEFRVTIIGGSLNEGNQVAVRYAPGDIITQATSAEWTPDSVNAQTVILPFTTGPDDEGVTLEFAVTSSEEGVYYKVDDFQLIEQ